jgi:hypothetical protein
MKLHALDMCIQLGRFIGRQTELVFVEPQSSAKGSIYAGPLPAKKHRLTPAIAIVSQPTGEDDALARHHRMQIVFHAQGRSNKEVMDLLAEVQELLFPGGRYRVATEGSFMPGVIGVTSEPGTHFAWRLLELTLLSFPQTTPRSPGGQAVAEFAIDAYAVPYTATVEE